MNIVIRGKVRIGRQIGSKTIVPTANISLHKTIVHGVYISKTKIQGIEYPSVTFVGKSKTTKSCVETVETHIIGLKKNLYNQWISVRLIKKIRKNYNFNSLTELKRAIQKDIQITKQYYKIK